MYLREVLAVDHRGAERVAGGVLSAAAAPHRPESAMWAKLASLVRGACVSGP